MAMVLNEAAVKYMGLKEPIGMQIRWQGKDYHVIGVAQDMVMTSPFQSIPPTVFSILHEGGNYINIRINPHLTVQDALKKMETVFKQYNPAAPFEYTFVNQEYATKFNAEERIAKLATVFAALAIIISCLELFGLASFIAEQRTKEVGIRKVLGASVFNLWQMLSKDFALLVLLSCCLATPVAWYFLHKWLLQYEYRTHISWIIFLSVGAGALVIALSTVSYQAIKTALSNPVKSLRAE
jgi:ABC-type antimicrobial peptide transport system permease subunit